MLGLSRVAELERENVMLHEELLAVKRQLLEVCRGRVPLSEGIDEKLSELRQEVACAVAELAKYRLTHTSGSSAAQTRVNAPAPIQASETGVSQTNVNTAIPVPTSVSQTSVNIHSRIPTHPRVTQQNVQATVQTSNVQTSIVQASEAHTAQPRSGWDLGDLDDEPEIFDLGQLLS